MNFGKKTERLIAKDQFLGEQGINDEHRLELRPRELDRMKAYPLADMPTLTTDLSTVYCLGLKLFLLGGSREGRERGSTTCDGLGDIVEVTGPYFTLMLGRRITSLLG